MNFLPIVQRELLLASRSTITVWLRFIAALGAMAVFSLLLAAGVAAHPQRLSDLLFGLLAYPLFTYAVLAGPLHVADSLCSERREGTLGLLFLTDLRGYDIVLGKLAASSLRVFGAVLAVIPVMALPILLGGVSAAQFWRTVAAILITLLLSLSVAMLWSSTARDLRTAVAGTLLTLAILMFLPPAATRLWHFWRPASLVWPDFFSPLALMAGAQDRMRRAHPNAPAVFAAGWQLQLWLALAALAAASRLVSTHGAGTTRGSARGRESGVSRFFDGLGGYRHASWADWLEEAPYVWYQRVFRPVPLMFKLAFGIGLALTAAMLGRAVWEIRAGGGSGVGETYFVFYLFGLYALHQLLKFQVGLTATRGPCEDRQEGGLELLLISGLSAQDIVAGHRRTLRCQYGPAMGLLTALHVAGFACLFVDSIAPSVPSAIAGTVIGLPLLLLDFAALALTGLRQALRLGDPLAAFRTTLLRVMLPGWLGFLLLAGAALSGRWVGPAILLWLGGVLVSGFWAIKRARIDVQYGFQQIAAGLPFDTDDWELREDFQRAVMKDVGAGPIRRLL